MSDQATGTAAATETVTEKPALTPATPHVEKTIPHPDVIHAKILEKLKAGPPSKTIPSLPTDEPKADDKPADVKPADAPKLKTDPATLRELGRLQKQVREFEGKAKEADALRTDATALREIKELWGKTREDKIAALAKLSGKAGLDELAAMVAMWYEEGQEDKPTGQAPTGELKAVLERLDNVSKELEALKTSKADESKASDANAAEAKATEFVTSLIKSNASKFEVMNRPDNIAEATELVRDGVWAIAKREGLVDLETGKLKAELTQEQADDLYVEAMKEVEAEFIKTGLRLAPSPKTPSWKFDFDPGRRVQRVSKPAVTTKPLELSKNPDKAFKELQQRMKERAENGGYRRGV